MQHNMRIIIAMALLIKVKFKFESNSFES